MFLFRRKFRIEPADFFRGHTVKTVHLKMPGETNFLFQREKLQR